jgi:UTP--glucose-1-phosphate uridylyltransferase
MIKKCLFPAAGYGTRFLPATKTTPKDALTNIAIIRNTKLGKGGEIQITDALLKQAKKGNVIAYKFDDKRFDCGSVDGFVEATNYFYKKGL